MDANEIKQLLKAHQREIQRWLDADISAQVDLLNRAARDELIQEDYMDSVTDAHDNIMTILHGNAWNGDAVDPEFWETDMGRTMLAVRLWIDCDELITLREAAQILRGSAEDRDLVYVNDQIKRGRLERYTNPNEPNPQRAGRVSRNEVEYLRDGI